MSQGQSPRDDQFTPSLKRHRRESFWQITFPILLFIAILLGAFALVILTGTTGISGVADMALILVSLPLLVIGLIVLALFVGLVVGVVWLASKTPVATGFVQDMTTRAAGIVQKAMQIVANAIMPVIAGFSTARQLMSRQGQESGESSRTDSPPVP